MKKMVKLLSVVLLVAMCFSFFGAGAYAAEPVVISGGNSQSSGTTVFSYGTSNADQMDLENGISEENNVIVEPDGRLNTDGRDNSLFVADVDSDISDTVWELVSKYAGDVNINNDTNPYYFVWLMNKFVNGEIDYANPDSELETARLLFGEFIDEAAESLAVTAAYNQVVESDEEVKEAVEAVADENTEATIEQQVIAEEAENKIEETAEEIISDINNADGASFNQASANKGRLCVSSAVYSSDNTAKFSKTAFDLHNVIVSGGTITVYEQQVLDTSYTGDIVFDFKNCTVNCSGTTPLVVVNSGLFKFKNGIINGSFIRVKGGSVILDNMKVNVPAGGNCAVQVDGGYVDMVRSNYFTSKSTEAVVYAVNGNVIFDGYIESNTAVAGILINGSAKVTKNGGDILYTEPATDIYAPVGVMVLNGTFVFNGGNITGTGKATGSSDYGAAISAADSDTVNVTINGGTTSCILSAYNAAIYVIDGKGSTPTKATIAVSDLSYLKDATGYKSDVSDTLNVATVNGIGYTTLADAVKCDDAKNGYSVEIINDVEISSTALIDSGASIVVNGNGHTVYSAVDAFKVTDGSLILQNITIDCKNKTANAVNVNGANADATLTNVTADNCAGNAVEINAGSLVVNEFYAEESGSGTVAIAANGGNTDIYDMETKSEAPIKGTSGIKVYQAKCKVPTADNTLEKFKADTVCSDITKCLASGSSEAISGGYYYVSAREVTLEILSGGASDGSYLLYEKGVADQVLQIRGSDAIESMAAIAQDGTVNYMNFKSSSDYKTATITETNLKNLLAGEYTLNVKFKNSGVVKVPLYISPSLTQKASESETDLYLTDYDKDNAIWKYNAQSQKNGWIKIASDDLPEHIGLGPDRDTVIWLSDANIEAGVLDSNNKLQITITHDDLDHLSNGVNYVWLDYGTYWVPVKFVVYNAAAAISPTITDWNKIDGDKVFTVWPDVLTVKLNGESLNSDTEYTYKDGTLTLKSSFLKKLANGSYTLEVSTSKGGVYSELSIGEVLRPKDIDYHVYGGTKAITFVGSNTIDFEKGIWIGKQNPVQIPSEYYTINSDKSFTLSANYLNRLTTLGTYYISAYVGEQYCTTTFRIISASQASTNPSTGDVNLTLWIIILVLAAVVIVVILVPMIKKNGSKKTNTKSKKESQKE